MYAQKNHNWILIFSGLLSLLLVGCSANMGKTVKISEQQETKYGALSASDALAELEKRVNEAKSANMPFFAPNHFRGASEILSKAQKTVQKSSDKTPKNELISEISKADAILDKGQTMMAIVQSRLVNELEMKNQLDKDNVAKVYPKEYGKLISELSSLIEKVELEKADKIDKDKIELIKKMRALDVKAIQYTALHESDVINEDTESNDGEELAPATLAEALRVYKDAENKIAQAPHDAEVVQRAGTDSIFAARHARNVSRRVLDLQNKFKESVEPIALEEEKRLLSIATALGQSDPRDRPIEKQAEAIAQFAGELVQGQQQSKQAIGAVNDQSKVFEKRLKDANDATQQANAQLTEKDAQLTEKDAQLKVLNEKIAQLELQNKPPVKAKTAKAKLAKTQPKIPAN